MPNVRSTLPFFLLSFAPGLALAQAAPAKTQDTAACFDLAFTLEPNPALSALLSPATGSVPASFVGKPKGGTATVCVGPYASEAEAGLGAIALLADQPLSERGVLLDGFVLAAMSGPVTKGENKLGAPVNFAPHSASVAAALQDRFQVDAKLAAVASTKAYAFEAADARVPAKEDALATLEKGQAVLSIGQEELCEPGVGCLYWERVLSGDHNVPSYVQAGQVIFEADALPAPSGGWSLYVRPRAVLPFAPVSYQSDPDGKGAATSTVVFSLWAKGSGQTSPEALDPVEVPGETPSELSVAFTAEGVSIQRANDAKSLRLVAIDTRRFPLGGKSAGRTSDAVAPSAAPGSTGSEKKATATAPKKKPVKIHKVKNGDTLWDIAQKYNVSVDSLRRANGLSKKAVLQPGQKLVIPNA